MWLVSSLESKTFYSRWIRLLLIGHCMQSLVHHLSSSLSNEYKDNYCTLLSASYQILLYMEVIYEPRLLLAVF